MSDAVPVDARTLERVRRLHLRARDTRSEPKHQHRPGGPMRPAGRVICAWSRQAGDRVHVFVDL